MFLILGLSIRLLINQHFYFFLAGTFITSLGFCFMMNSPNKFVVNWFPVNQTLLMNGLCMFSIFMSDSLGTFASAVFIDEDSDKHEFVQFFAYETITISIILLLKGIFFRGSPKTPPKYTFCNEAMQQMLLVRDTYNL